MTGFKDLRPGNECDLSVIIPTYNRVSMLRPCLESLALQSPAPASYEVLVVDDGSSCSPASLMESFRSRLDIRLLRQANQGPAAARNLGAAEARGRYLAFLDDDCRVPPDWLEAIARQAEHMDGSVLGGLTVNAITDNLFSTASQLLVDYLYTYYNADPDDCRFFTSNNLLVPRELFHKAKGFDGAFRLAAGEDRELCDRLRQHGTALRYRPEVTVYHAHGMQLLAFLKQHFYYGRGALVYHRLRAARSSTPLRIEPLSFYLDLLSHPFQKYGLFRALPLSVLLLATQAANCAGFLWELCSSRGR